MGRETTAQVRWQGQQAEAKVLLETSELILRGSIRTKFPREAIGGAVAGPDGLSISIGGEELHLFMGEAEALRWAKAIATPPPSLASKLGASPDRPAFVLGQVEDAALAEALAGAVAPTAANAALLVAVIEDMPGLDRALALAKAHPALPIWCIYPKGKAANPGDSAVRSVFRAAGWMDNKTSAVSERLTATRYAFKG